MAGTARQSGYQDGYRDGTAALDSFKQSFASQATAQIGALIDGFDRQFAALDSRVAQAVAGVSVQLAQQVLRAELQARPELVARVASEAVNSVMFSARHIAVQVHPLDLPLVAEGAEEALKARGARLLPNPAIERGGVLVESDVGSVDADGFFTITDRMKDIIITAGGKNVTPSELENELKFSPYITDAVVIGDKRPYLTAIVMIDQENVEKYAQDNDVPFSNYLSLTRSTEVLELIQTEMDRVNKKFARVEQIKKFFLLETQLSAEDEELTPTMKLKRKLVEKKYATQVEAMYR